MENNGYSKVETNAPDMEQSVIANPDPQVLETFVAPVEKKKRAPAKKKRTAVPKATAKKETDDGFKRVEVGGEMPYYLL